MAQRQKIPFLGGTLKDRSLSVNNQLTDNLITSVKGPGAKQQVVLETAPGLITRGSITAGGANRARKWLSWKGLGYAVFGNTLYSISNIYAIAVIGTLNTNSGQVVMARGRTAIMITDGTNGYSYDGSTFAEITDPAYPDDATHCVYIDGAFIVNDPDTDNFFRSDQEDPTTWNALNFEAASVQPDNVLAIEATESILYIIGEETMQPYFNSGDADFPYDVYLQGVEEIGIAAIHSTAESDDGVFWLATTPQGGLFVYRMQGTSGQVITGDEESWLIDQIETPESAIGFIYTQVNKSFYVLQFPDDAITMVFNIGAGVWETRSKKNGDNWPVGGHGIINKKNIVGDLRIPKFYELDLNTYNYDGEEMIRKRRTQITHANDNYVEWHELVLDFEQGRSPVDVVPVVKIRYSNDGGKWSKVMTRELGSIGDFNFRTKLTKLGSGKNRIWEWWISGDFNLTFKAAYGIITVNND